MEKRISAGLIMLKDEIKNIKETKKDLRQFGVVVGSACILISALLFYLQKPSYVIFAVIGVILIALGLIVPGILKPLNKAWMILALILGWIMTRVILILLYYLVLTPTSFLARLTGKKFLDLDINKQSSSYWIYRERKSSNKVDYERQF